MRQKSPTRLQSVSMLAVLITAGVAPVRVSVASAEPAPEMVDGKPTAEACRRYGYDLARTEETDAYRGGGAIGMPAYMIPPPPPAPAPTPLALPPPATVAPSPAGDMAEVAVTAQKRSSRMSPRAVMAYAPTSEPDTERYPQATSNPIRQVATDPVSTFSIDVDTASYANVRRFLLDGQRPPRDAVRVEELVNYFDYGYPRPNSKDEPFKPFVAVTPSPWADGKQIIHIGLQGYATPQAEQPPLNLVFLIDVSGSMSSPDKLPLAKTALNVLIDRLRPEDRVSMAVYAGNAGAVLDPTPGTQKLKMRCALEALEAGGSTAGGEGLALAYRLAERHFDKAAVNRVVLMTDGDFNVGVTSDRKLEDFVADKRKSGVYLSAYGFGRGNYNDRMMQTLAQAGNGVAGYIDSPREADKLFRSDFSSSVFPIADDVKIQVEFNPRRVAEYRLIGYETRMLNREDFNNDQVDAGEVGSGAAVTALYEITPVGGPRSADPLRYGTESAAPSAATGELAYLKIRYKLPGAAASKLMQRPIGQVDVFASVAAAPEATRMAEAVAAYGQKLRRDPWTPDSYGWDRIAAMAGGARGNDPIGLRAEFVDLVHRAASARPLGE